MYENTGHTNIAAQEGCDTLPEVTVAPVTANVDSDVSTMDTPPLPNEQTPVIETVDITAKRTEPVSEDVNTITLKKPFTLNGKHYETLCFDFGKLSFADLEMMEMDMTTKGMAVMKNAFLSDVYCMYVAAMACGVNVNDLKKHLGFKDCFRVIGVSRNFLKDTDSDQPENSATQ